MTHGPQSKAWPDVARAWTPPPGWTEVVAIDAHTAGEPLRVVLDGFPDPQGETILARRRWARDNHDDLRRALMWEPRGHADMYGCIVTPPVTPEAEVGVLFTHNEGFSTMCGHGIVGVATVLIECGLVDVEEPVTELGIDTPAGFVRARGRVSGGRVGEVSFENVPSFAARLDAEVEVPGVGEVRYDLGYGGAFYAYVDAAAFGLDLVPSESSRLIDLGRRIKEAVQAADAPVHPEDEDLGFVYGTIFVGPAHGPEGGDVVTGGGGTGGEGHGGGESSAGDGIGLRSRNVCVFAEGEMDRSPTGTGVSGRLALHAARGEVGLDEEIVVESILGTTFRGRVVRETRLGGMAAVVPEVTGRAWITGRNHLLIAPDDPLGGGFLIR